MESGPQWLGRLVGYSVLRSFVNWGVLCDTSTNGVYRQGLVLPITTPRLISWLVEASLWGRSEGTGVLGVLLDNPSLFPLRLYRITVRDLLAASPCLELLSQGLNDDLSILRPSLHNSQL